MARAVAYSELGFRARTRCVQMPLFPAKSQSAAAFSDQAATCEAEVD